MIDFVHEPPGLSRRKQGFETPLRMMEFFTRRLRRMPNFYFHCTTAYDILRYCGVELGKRDFIGTI